MRSGEALRHDQDEDDEERKAMIWLRAHIVRHRPDFSGYGPDDSLEILGIDSLASVLLVRSVRSCLTPYGKRIGSNDLFGETLRSFARRHLLGLDLTVKEEEYDEVSREDEEEEEAKLLSSSSLEIEESAPEDYGIKLHPPPPPPPPPPPKTAKLLLSIRGILTLLVLYEHFHGPERVISPLVSSNTSLFVLLSGFSTALSSSSSTSNLLVTRAVGIFPLLWVALLLNAPRWIEEDMIRSHGLSPRGHPIVPDVDISPDFYLKRDSLICDVLYVLALQCWYRPQCRERGPNNVIYASILWSVFVLYVGALWVCRHCALPRACSFSSPRLNLGASVVGMVLTALFLHMKNGLSFFCFFMTGVSAAELFKELWEKKHSASSSPRPPTFFLVAADDAIALALVFSFWLPTIPHLSFWLQNCGVHLLVVFFLLVSLLSDADGIAAKALFSALFEPLRLIGFASYPTYLVQRAFCDTWLPMFTHLLHRGEWVWDVHDSRGVETYSLFGKATTLALLLLFSYALQRYVQDGLVASLYARLQ